MASELMLVNPKKRRKAKRKTAKRAKSTARRRRRNPVALAGNPRRRKSYRRRNPSSRAGIKGIVKSTVMPSMTAAIGATALDLIVGITPLPENLKTGPVGHVVKGAGAIALGLLAGNFVSRETARQFTTGALTVTMYNAGKQAITKFAPNIAAKMDGLGVYELDGLGYAGSGYMVGDESDYLDGLGVYDNVGVSGLSIDDAYQTDLEL